MALISVIIPVYQAEKHLHRCLDSVINQTYRDMEIILIDDGSRDNSGAICDEYANQDDRIKVIHQENRGQAVARNVGLDCCIGEYVTFVDSDDYVDPDYCERLFELLEGSEADLSICGFDLVLETDYCDVKTNSKISRDVRIVDSNEALKKLFYQNGFDTSVWSKLYKSKLFANIKFPEGRIYEDLAIVYRLFNQCKSIAYTNDIKYHYVQRCNSTTGGRFATNMMDAIQFAEEMCEFVRKHYPTVYTASICRLVSANFNIYFKIPSEKEFQEYRSIIESNIKRYRKTVLLDREARRKTKIASLLSYLGFPIVRHLWNIGFRG